ncbi:MAG: hypothetical protein KY445_15135, partial [Armatimonadetes bacterium]|nr:hypothetical protein [Armatimonadota bacterium]
MKGEVRPRSLAHRGVVMATGWWLDPALCGEGEARRRVLAHWENGARLFGVEGGNLLLFASPRLLRADIAPATILTEREGWLLAAPLSDSEWQELHAHAPSSGEIGGRNLALVRDGALLVARGAQALDPSLWLDTQDWESVELEALGEVAALAVAATPAVDVRRALDVPASPELARFLAQMRGEELSDAPPSWRERWRALWKGSGEARQVEGGVRVEKRRFWLDKLFDFRFGAGGDVPGLREGEKFSSEFGMVAHAFFVAALLALLGSAFTWPQNGLGGALQFWVGLLVWLLPIAALAWLLMVLARLVPVPPHVARKLMKSPPPAWRSFLPLDLLGVMLLCATFWMFWNERDWFWMTIAALGAFIMALHAHWERRRLDPVEVAA